MIDIKAEWNKLRDNAVKPVWKLFRHRYEMVGIGYEEFENIAYIYLSKAIKTYKSSKSGVNTYAINVLKRRMGDYLRNNYNTDKTRANFCPQSLNVPVSGDSEMELEETLVDDRQQRHVENNVFKIKKFLKTLSNKQKDILLLKTIGLDEDEILGVMDISSEEYAENMKKLRSPRRVAKLMNGVN